MGASEEQTRQAVAKPSFKFLGRPTLLVDEEGEAFRACKYGICLRCVSLAKAAPKRTVRKQHVYIDALALNPSLRIPLLELGGVVVDLSRGPKDTVGSVRPLKDAPGECRQEPHLLSPIGGGPYLLYFRQIENVTAIFGRHDALLQDHREQVRLVPKPAVYRLYRDTGLVRDCLKCGAWEARREEQRLGRSDDALPCLFRLLCS